MTTAVRCATEEAPSLARQSFLALRPTLDPSLLQQAALGVPPSGVQASCRQAARVTVFVEVWQPTLRCGSHRVVREAGRLPTAPEGSTRDAPAAGGSFDARSSLARRSLVRGRKARRP